MQNTILDFIQHHAGLISVLIITFIGGIMQRRKAAKNTFSLYNLEILDGKSDNAINAGFYTSESKAKDEADKIIEEASQNTSMSRSYKYNVNKVAVNNWDGKVGNEVYEIVGFDGDATDMENAVGYYYFTKSAKIKELCAHLNSVKPKENWSYNVYELNKNYYSKIAE